MQKTLQYFRDFAERAGTLSKRKHLRAVGLMTANDWRDVASIVSGLLSRKDAIDGPHIARFETAFGSLLGGGHAISFGAGRVAFAAILDAMEIAEGDEVIMPGYTCVVVPNPVLYRNAKPVYADVDRNSLNLDPDEVRKKITPRTRAILVQHTFGMPADFDAIARIARPLGIRLIEDCTHALGARYSGRRIGTLGDASFFSMEQAKLMSTGMGGIAFTCDPELGRRIASFQRERCVWPQPTDVALTLSYLLYHAVLQGPRSSMLGDLLGYYLNRLGLMKTPAYSAAELQCRRPPDFLQRLPNGLARVALSQLRGLPRNLARRNAVAQVYAKQLPQAGFRAAAVPPGYDPVYLRYPLWVDDKDGLVDFMHAQEIGVGVWFNSPIHPRGVKYQHAGYTEGSCPNAEAAVRHVINLPSHPRMSEQDAMRVVTALRDYGKERGVAAQEILCG